MQTCLSKSFVFRVTHVDDKIAPFESAQLGAFNTPDARFVEFVADMAEIQQKIKLPIIIPLREFAIDEKRVINELRTILHEGKIPIHGEVNLSVFPRGIPPIIETFGNEEKGLLRIEAKEMVELFGTEIPLGKVLYTAKVCMINEQEVREICISTHDSNTPIDVKFKIVEEGHTYYKEYLDWLPKMIPKEL